MPSGMRFCELCHQEHFEPEANERMCPACREAVKGILDRCNDPYHFPERDSLCQVSVEDVGRRLVRYSVTAWR